MNHKAQDMHCNMVLENVKEMWTKNPKTSKGKKKAQPINKDSFISRKIWQQSKGHLQEVVLQVAEFSYEL